MCKGGLFLGDCSEKFLLFSIVVSPLFSPSVSLETFARSREDYQSCCIFCASLCFYHSSPFPLDQIANKCGYTNPCCHFPHEVVSVAS